MPVRHRDNAVTAAIPQTAGVKHRSRRAHTAHQLPPVGVAEQRHIGTALAGTFRQPLAAHLYAVMVAVGVEKQHTRKGDHALGGFLVSHIAVACHAVDRVRHGGLVQLQCTAQVIQTVPQVKHGISGLVLQDPAQVTHAAVYIGNN